MDNDLRSKIYVVRGVEVMLDRDLAEIYGYTTKAFNQQVQRNIEKFEGEEFMFQLTMDEVGYCSRCKNCTLNVVDNNSLRSQFVTLKNGRGQHSKYLPYAFTEQGIYMLMTVLKGELAIKQSRKLIMMFKMMKDYVIKSQNLIDCRESLSITAKILNNMDDITKTKEKIDAVDIEVKRISSEMNDMVKKSEISPIFSDFNKMTESREYLLLDGEPIRAKEAYMDIYKHAKKKIYIIDNYVNIKSLHLLQLVKKNLEIVFFTDNLHKLLRKSDVDDFNVERPDLKITFIKTNRKIHDRFIILDDFIIYQAGGSSKDAGNKMTSIHEITDDFVKQSLVDEVGKLKQNSPLILK